MPKVEYILHKFARQRSWGSSFSPYFAATHSPSKGYISSVASWLVRKLQFMQDQTYSLSWSFGFRDCLCYCISSVLSNVMWRASLKVIFPHGTLKRENRVKKGTIPAGLTCSRCGCVRKPTLNAIRELWWGGFVYFGSEECSPTFNTARYFFQYATLRHTV